jgi:hypothetical protein
VLLGEQSGGGKHADLLAGDGGNERRTQGHFGLAETHIAADHAIHGARLREITDHRFDGLQLVGGFLELEGRCELLVHEAVDRQRGAASCFALRIDGEQFRRHIAHLLGRAALGALPGIAAQGMQWCKFG